MFGDWAHVRKLTETLGMRDFDEGFAVPALAKYVTDSELREKLSLSTWDPWNKSLLLPSAPPTYSRRT